MDWRGSVISVGAAIGAAALRNLPPLLETATMNDRTKERPGMPASMYLRTELDESGEMRVVANVPELPTPTSPAARHVRRTLEAL